MQSRNVIIYNYLLMIVSNRTVPTIIPDHSQMFLARVQICIHIALTIYTLLTHTVLSSHSTDTHTVLTFTQNWHSHMNIDTFINIIHTLSAVHIHTQPAVHIYTQPGCSYPHIADTLLLFTLVFRILTVLTGVHDYSRRVTAYLITCIYFIF